MPDLAAELYVDGSWVDISNDVAGRDQIVITEGRSDESTQVQAGQCKITLKNASGNYSPYNAVGAYYGSLGRNTPIRVFADGYHVFTGEVSEWPIRGDSGSQYVTVEASGVLRRLAQGAIPLRSPMFRGIAESLEPLIVPVAYWPCEEDSNATWIYPARPELGSPMKVTEGISLGSYSDFTGSEPVLTLNDRMIYGDVPAYGAVGDEIQVGMLVAVPDDGVAQNDTVLFVLHTTGTTGYWRVRINTDGTFNLRVARPRPYGGGNGHILTTSNSSYSLNGRRTWLSLRLWQDGVQAYYSVRAYPVGGDAAVSTLSGSISETFRKVWRVSVGGGLNAGSTSIGHIAAFHRPSALWTFESRMLTLLRAHRGEMAGRRMERLCLEEGIPFGALGDLDDSQAMGPQKAQTGLDLLQEAADADGGVLFEPSEVVTLGGGQPSHNGSWIPRDVTLTSSTAQAHTGADSLLMTVADTSDPLIEWWRDQFIVGLTYTYSAWVYVPAGNARVDLLVSNFSAPASATSTQFDEWERLHWTFTATQSDQWLAIRPIPADSPTVGNVAYLDDITITCDRPGLAFRPIRATYNQGPAATADFQQDHVMPPFEPTDDDRYLANEISVQVPDQGTATWQLQSGPLSLQSPPAGAGRYNREVTRAVLTGRQAYNHASWLVHTGTWEELRYPQIMLNLRRHPELIPTVARLAVGARLTLVNPPPWLPPESIEQIVQGKEVRLDVETWDVLLNTTPARIHDVWELESEEHGRLAALDSQLDASITDTQASFAVRSASGQHLWTADPADFPLDILIGGELMTVTSVSGASSPQTFTVTRSVNGIVKPHLILAPVRLRRRTTLAL